MPRNNCSRGVLQQLKISSRSSLWNDPNLLLPIWAALLLNQLAIGFWMRKNHLAYRFNSKGNIPIRNCWNCIARQRAFRKAVIHLLDQKPQFPGAFEGGCSPG